MFVGHFQKLHKILRVGGVLSSGSHTNFAQNAYLRVRLSRAELRLELAKPHSVT